MQEFFLRPPPSEDYVQYSIYFPGQQDTTYLQQQATLMSSFVLPYTQGYIWHKDAFGLLLAANTSTRDPSYSYLKGRTRFGDALEDEWFIVFLLREISKEWPNVVISVSDCDGEFLLVEAASQLPKWLQPRNSTNRVFLHQGQLHIIPMPKASIERPAGKITVSAGVEFVASSSMDTRASEDIQKAVFDRISEYPEKARQNIHHARVTIPRTLASVLSREPQLVAPAVEAFYMRDPIAMRAIHRMERFPPSDSMDCTIPLTRTLYAQLVSQRFYAPKPFKMPPVANSLEYKRAELGMKLACGMEMLAAEKPTRSSSRNENASLDAYDFQKDKCFVKFHERLTLLGYFKGEVQGSKLYTQLEKVAKEQYLRDKFADSDGEEHQAEYPSVRIARLLSLPPFTDDELHALLNRQPDSDTWMDLNEADLEAAFAARRALGNFRDDSDLDEYENNEYSDDDEESSGNRNRRRNRPMNDDLVDEDDSDGEWEDEDELDDDEEMGTDDALRGIRHDDLESLSTMVRKLEIFMSGQSGIDGVELQDECDEDDEDDDDMEEEDEELFREVRLDPAIFIREMSRAIGMPTEEIYNCHNNSHSTARTGPVITEINSDEDDETLLPPDPRCGPVPPSPPSVKSFQTESNDTSSSSATASNTPLSTRSSKNCDNCEDEDEDSSDLDEAGMEEYLKAMDAEIYGGAGSRSKIGQDFERVSTDKLKKARVIIDSDDDIDDGLDDPRDTDSSPESFSAQGGLPGPASTLLGSLGVNIPRIHTPDTSEEMDVDEEGDNGIMGTSRSGDASGSRPNHQSKTAKKRMRVDGKKRSARSS
ncbi:hypothetical protein SeMB42_g02655 [Synchytrium endobioticum]|uniref:Uncharacterized protein n=1 Tax=Synchytrium endobioticum TaxID=286115 RepID=A0A507DCF0_9FUNG|nr:hypothetical protein SeMB42_g02655 [Synchytrium endobioticum]